MNILNKIMDETSQCKDQVYQHSYSNNNLDYSSSLRGFNSKLFSLFKYYYDDLKVSQSIQSLFRVILLMKLKINQHCIMFIEICMCPHQTITLLRTR